MTRTDPPPPFRLGEWTVRPDRLRMERGDDHVEIEPKVMEVLLHLAERPDEVHTRRELLDTVWPGVVVGDEALTRAIYELRKALGDRSKSPRYIETIPKIGYRLIADVHPVGSDGSPGNREAPVDAGERKFRTLLDESFDIATVINRDGTIRYAVPAFESVLGYSPGEVEGRSIFDLIVPEDRDRVREEFRRSLERSGPSPTIQARFSHVDGSTRTLRGRGHSFFEDPDIDGLLLMTREITDGESGSAGSDAPGKVPGRSLVSSLPPVVLPLLILLLLGAGGLIAWALVGSRESADARAATILRVTTEPGIERTPAASPDGRRIAYAGVGSDGGSRLFVRGFDQGRPLRITMGPGSDHSPAWSPDGERIAYIRTDGERCSIRVVSALGGPDSPLTECAGAALNSLYHHLSWSPDGRWIAFSDGPGNGDGARVHLVDVESGERRSLPSEGAGREGAAFVPTFSPTGGRIAFARYGDGGSALVVRGVRDGRLVGDSRVVADSLNNVDGIAWSPDEEGLVFSSDRSGVFSLYETGLADREVRPIGVGQDVRRPTAVPGRDLILYEAWTFDLDVWAYPGPAGPEASPAPEGPLVDSTQRDVQPAVTPDGRRVAFLSNRTGRHEVWGIDVDGGDPTALTELEGRGMVGPRWSPDGSRLVVGVQIGVGNDPGADLWVVDDPARPARRLTDWAGHEFVGDWSPDGRWIYFGSRRTGEWEIWRVPVGGGSPERVTDDGGYVARVGGERLYYTKPERDGLWSRPIAGGPETRVTERFPSWDLFWILRDGAAWRIARDPSTHLARLDLGTGTWERVADLPDDVAAGFDLGPGLETLYVARDAGSTSDLRAVAFP